MTLLTIIAKMSEGLGKTCAIFFLTLLFSLPLGMIITFLRMSKSKVISSVTRFVVAVLRGTPLMLQLIAVTYGPYYLFGTAVSKNKLIPVVIAFAINYAAYFSEIYRGGIESIPAGQYEAANVLGYTKAQTPSRSRIRRCSPSASRSQTRRRASRRFSWRACSISSLTPSSILSWARSKSAWTTISKEVLS